MLIMLPSRSCYVQPKVMVRTARLFILIALVGAPASALACDLYCASLGTADHQHAALCHDGAADHDGRQVSSIEICHSDVAIGTFLTQVRQTAPQASRELPVTVEVPAPTLFAAFATTTRWRGPRAQPPGGPPRHTVLRI